MIRILIVDDLKTIRESLKTIFESTSDLQVIGTASDGQTAIEQAEILQPDIVLIDMEMPGLDGIAATRIIVENFPSIKPIVLSIHDEDKYVSRAMQAGAIGYLLKNTPGAEIKDAIRFAYKGYSQISPGLLPKIVTPLPEPNSNLRVTNVSKPTKPIKSEADTPSSSLKISNP